MNKVIATALLLWNSNLPHKTWVFANKVEIRVYDLTDSTRAEIWMKNDSILNYRTFKTK